MATRRDEYQFHHSRPSHTESYLWPVVLKHIEGFFGDSAADQPRRIFDLGCGNGAFLRHLDTMGFEVSGVDTSHSGVARCNSAAPDLNVQVGSAYDDLRRKFGNFPIVVSLEVVEHIYSPYQFAQTLYDLVAPNGIAIISTPFHGYWKNLMLAVTGKLDSHFTALWDHGHIKFWSVATLSKLLAETGFADVTFDYAGRFYPFSKSMVAIAARSDHT